MSTVLFVEKRRDVLPSVQILLKHRGHDVIGASNYAEASLHLSSATIVIATLNDDSAKDAEAFLRRFREDRWKPAIAITAYLTPEHIERLIAAGFDKVLPEPLRMHLLIDAIEELSNRKN